MRRNAPARQTADALLLDPDRVRRACARTLSAIEAERAQATARLTPAAVPGTPARTLAASPIDPALHRAHLTICRDLDRRRARVERLHARALWQAATGRPVAVSPDELARIHAHYPLTLAA
jgi:hypothetical protein